MEQPFETNLTRDLKYNMLILLCRLSDGRRFQARYQDNSNLTVLEDALQRYDTLHDLLPKDKDMSKESRCVQAAMKMQAVLVCCKEGDFAVAEEVFDRLYPRRGKDEEKETKERLTNLIKSRNKSAKFLQIENYDSFVKKVVKFFEKITNGFNKPYLTQIAEKECLPTPVAGNMPRVSTETQTDQTPQSSPSSKKHPAHPAEISPTKKRPAVSAEHSPIKHAKMNSPRSYVINGDAKSPRSAGTHARGRTSTPDESRQAGKSKNGRVNKKSYTVATRLQVTELEKHAKKNGISHLSVEEEEKLIQRITQATSNSNENATSRNGSIGADENMESSDTEADRFNISIGRRLSKDRIFSEGPPPLKKLRSEVGKHRLSPRKSNEHPCKIPWTTMETEKFYKAVKKMGVSQWSQIRDYLKTFRTNIQLKDKWRNIVKSQELLGTLEKKFGKVKK